MESIFSTPAMTWWAAAAAVPLVIHLLSRRRYKRVPWAAMDFLNRAFKRTRKRLRIENILLLLIRMLILIMLALALANPRLSSSAIFGDQAAGAQHVLIVLDDSYSMGVKNSVGATRFDRGRGMAERILDGLDGSRDSAALVTAGAPARIVFKPSNDVERVKSAIAGLSVSDRATDTIGALRRISSLLAEPSVKRDYPGGKTVYVIGDLQKYPMLAPASRQAWGLGDLSNDEPDPSIEESLRSIRDLGGRVVMVDVGENDGEAAANVAITSLRHVGKGLAKGIPATFECRIRNYGDRDASGELLFFVDQEKNFAQREQVAGLRGRSTGTPGETEATYTFSATFTESGPHYVAVQFRSDALETDNLRRFSFRVRDNIRVLAVDGSAGREPEDSATFYVSRALDPSLGQLGGGSSFRTREVNLVEFQSEALEDYDMVVLADVSTMAPRKLRELEDFVSQGGALFWFGGKTFDTPGRSGQDGSSNALFYKQGRGLLPAPIKGSLGQDEFTEAPYFMQIDEFDHPAMSYFEDERRRPTLTRWPVYKFLELDLAAAKPNTPTAEESEGEEEDEAPYRVLSWFRSSDSAQGPADATLHPAIVERRFGRGRVVVFTTSADKTWNLYGTTPAFVPLMREMAYHVTRELDQNNLSVGAAWNQEFPPTVTRLLVTRGEAPPIERSTTLVEDKSAARIAFTRFEKSELLRLQIPADTVLPEDSEVDREHLISVNVEASESDLSRADEGWLASNFGTELLQVIRQPDELEEQVESSEESGLWRLLLYVVLGLLVLETIVAQRFTASSGGAA